MEGAKTTVRRCLGRAGKVTWILRSWSLYRKAGYVTEIEKLVGPAWAAEQESNHCHGCKGCRPRPGVSAFKGRSQQLQLVATGQLP